MTSDSRSAPVAVVGGGLAGLAAAVLLARAGRSAVVFEKSARLGGRAVTQEEEGFRFNLGAHALYRGGEGMAVLRALGVETPGGVPVTSGGHAVRGGAAHALPGGPVSLLATGLLRLPAKLEVGRWLGSLQRIDAAAVDRVSLADWLARTLAHAEVRELVAALVRLSTYTDDPTRMSAGAALAQLQRALASSVLYIDGGWQALVDQLRAKATAAGVRIVAGARVAAVEHDGVVRAIRLADGTREPVAAAILTGGPTDAAALLAGDARATVERWATAAVPIDAATLDVGLTRLPRPRSTFALGIDRPLYFSVHSAVARLAPDGRAVVHVMKYLPPGTSGDARADERELEGLLDLVQPAWRDVLVRRRFLPSLRVTHALVTAAAGGLAGRPGPAVPGVRGLCVAGDWVGAKGMLADASLASVRDAVRVVVEGDAAAAA